MGMVHIHVFTARFTKGNNFCDFLFAFPGPTCFLFQNGYTILSNNLLQRSKYFPIRVNPL